jgi:hypothetical protein
MDGSIWDKCPADSREYALLRCFVSTHEAGHAVMSLKLEMPFDLVVIGKHEQLRASAAGGIIPKARHIVFPTPQYIYNRSLVLMAALVAHAQYLSPIMSDNEDWICSMLRESAGTDFEDLRNLWRTYMHVRETDMDALLEELVNHADRALDVTDHQCIRNVAIELDAKTILTEEEVKTICNGECAGPSDKAQTLKEIETLLARFSPPILQGKVPEGPK